MTSQRDSGGPHGPRPTPAQVFAMEMVRRRTQMFTVAMYGANTMVARETMYGSLDECRKDDVNHSGDVDAALDARLVVAQQERLGGSASWRALLEQEVTHAFAARTQQELHDRLVNVMGLAGAWVLRIEDRTR